MVAWNKIEVAWNIIEMVALNHFTSFCTIYNLHKQYGLFAPVNKKYTNEGFKTKQTVWIFKKMSSCLIFSKMNLVKPIPHSAQLCPTLWDPEDCSLPGSSVHGIFQARTVEWVANSSSRESSWPRDRAHISCVLCIGRQILYHCAT